jgi:hypothetical protein
MLTQDFKDCQFNCLLFPTAPDGTNRKCFLVPLLLPLYAGLYPAQIRPFSVPESRFPGPGPLAQPWTHRSHPVFTRLKRFKMLIFKDRGRCQATERADDLHTPAAARSLHYEMHSFRIKSLLYIWFGTSNLRHPFITSLDTMNIPTYALSTGIWWYPGHRPSSRYLCHEQTKSIYIY